MTVVAEVTLGDSWVTVSADVKRFEAVSSGADSPLQWENRFGIGRFTRFESPWRYCESPDSVGAFCVSGRMRPSTRPSSIGSHRQDREMPSGFMTEDGKMVIWGDEAHLSEQLLELRRMLGEVIQVAQALAFHTGIPDVIEAVRDGEILKTDLLESVENLSARMDEFDLS